MSEHNNLQMIRPLIIALTLGLCLGCVEEPTPLTQEGEAGVQIITGGEEVEDIAPIGMTTGGDEPAPQTGGQPEPPVGGELEPPVGGEPEPPPVDPPPPTEDLSACERFCQRTEDCLYPACEELEGLPAQQFCRGWCGPDNEAWLNQSASLSCGAFNERIFGFSPETRSLCQSVEESRCEQLCDFGEVCGLVGPDCMSNCEGAEVGVQLCFSGAATLGDCGRFLECLQGGAPPEGPNVQQICGQLCERETRCLLEECAPGSVEGSNAELCFERCVTLGPRQLQAQAQLSCEELVSQARAERPELDASCDLDEESACARLCNDLVEPCGALGAAACETECETWGEARFVCFSRATACQEVNTCLIPEEESARCERLCGHLEGCLTEACPPRILPPQLISSCTADCFNNPVSEGDLTQWEMSACREVREVVYRDNPQLRPICEGNQDFRPSPEECAAFCDNSLDACLLGGSALCLSACASLTRAEYECSLAAQGVCDEIDLCLSEP